MVRSICLMFVASAGAVGCASECQRAASEVTVDPAGGPEVSWEGEPAFSISFWQAESPDSAVQVVDVRCSVGSACISSPYVYGELPTGAVAGPAEFPELLVDEEYEVNVEAFSAENKTCGAYSERFRI